MADVLSALALLFEPSTFIMCFVGMLVGVILGAIPGLAAGLAITVMLPISFTMKSTQAFALLMSIWVGGCSGSFIGSILLGIPGTPSSLATTFDGYAMTKKGQATRALSIGTLSNFLGTAPSIIIAMIACPLIASVAVKMGPWEYFALSFMAITLVVSISKGNMVKGFIGAGMGLLLTQVGYAPISSTERFTFGSYYLASGFSMSCVMIGIFAGSLIIMNYAHGVNGPKSSFDGKLTGFKIEKGDFSSNIPNIIRSFLIGLGIGFLPGMGAALSNMVSYATAKNSSKHPEEFGTGIPDGIWAPEVANNASVGGAVIPMIALGIPGDGVTALLLGAFVLHGIQPGPTMFTKQGVMAYTIIIGCLVANVLLAPLGLGMTRIVAKIVQVRYTYLAPVIIMFCFAGAFAATGNTKELIICAGILIFSYILTVLDIDNTLTADRSQELPEEVAGWLDIMRRAGVRLTIVSNGAEKRVRPFAQKLGLAYLYRSAKPLPFALMAAQHRMGVKRRQMAMVGDQLYADRMAAALYGIPGLMVVPRGPDLGAQVILKRKWEKKHWQKYYDRGGKTL